MSEAIKAAVETAIAVNLPEVAAPDAAATTDAAQTAKVLEGLATITAELRAIRDTGVKVAVHCANALAYAARMAGPGNVKQFKTILGDCEKAILSESKVEKWQDLGPEARSYLAYKSQFAQWINDVKSSIADGVDPVTLRLQVSRWYANRPKGPAAGDGSKGTGAKKGSGKDVAPVVPTGEADPETGERMGVTLGMSKATIKVRGADGKYADETVNFPTAVVGGIARLMRQIAAKLHDDDASPDAIAEIVEALKFAHDTLGPSDGSKKKGK